MENKCLTFAEDIRYPPATHWSDLEIIECINSTILKPEVKRVAILKYLTLDTAEAIAKDLGTNLYTVNFYLRTARAYIRRAIKTFDLPIDNNLSLCDLRLKIPSACLQRLLRGKIMTLGSLLHHYYDPSNLPRGVSLSTLETAVKSIKAAGILVTGISLRCSDKK